MNEQREGAVNQRRRDSPEVPREVCRNQVLEVWRGVWVAFYVLWEAMEGC